MEKFLFLPEDYNYFLSRIYLKGLLKVSYDPKLVIALVQKDIHLDYLEEANSLLKRLLSDKLGSKNLFPEIVRLYLKVIEIKLSKGILSREEAEEEILKLLPKAKDEEVLLEIYKKCKTLGFRKPLLITVEKLANLSRDSTRWYKELYKLLIANRSYKKALETIDKLIFLSRSKKEKEELLREGIKLAVYLKRYDKAIYYSEILLRNFPISYENVKTAIDLALSRKDYNKAVQIALYAFRKTGKKEYFKRAVEIAMWGRKKGVVAYLLRVYGLKFLDDPEMAVFLLNTVRAIGNRNLAVTFAKKAFSIYGMNNEK
ncbi:MAG: hypothetical protein ABGX27_05520 [Desulfurobacteriaceae bacterium]